MTDLSDLFYPTQSTLNSWQTDRHTGSLSHAIAIYHHVTSQPLLLTSSQSTITWPASLSVSCHLNLPPHDQPASLSHVISIYHHVTSQPLCLLTSSQSTTSWPASLSALHHLNLPPPDQPASPSHTIAIYHHLTSQPLCLTSSQSTTTWPASLSVCSLHVNIIITSSHCHFTNEDY